MTDLSASSYYYKPKVDPIKKAQLDTDLRDKIELIQSEFPGYGYRRIHKHLLREGVKINGKRIRRVMRENGLLPEIRRAYTATTDSGHDCKIYDNLMKGLQVNGPNQAWAADITYIRISTCFVYLAIIMDVFSRKIIGWAVSKKLKRDLSLGALQTAIKNRQPPIGCIHHSDRGFHYACNDYISLLKSAGFRISMSRKGNPYDNCYAESFMKTLKHEEVFMQNYETYADVLDRLPYFIEEVYNKKRLHSGIGYVPPEEFEEQFIKTMAHKSSILSKQQLSSS
jgi:transposase InsO family protein